MQISLSIVSRSATNKRKLKYKFFVNFFSTFALMNVVLTREEIGVFVNHSLTHVFT